VATNYIIQANNLVYLEEKEKRNAMVPSFEALIMTAIESWNEAEMALDTNQGRIDDLVSMKINKARLHAQLAIAVSTKESVPIQLTATDEEDLRP
jgi:hypothetical protein